MMAEISTGEHSKRLVEVSSPEQVVEVNRLACEIWREHYTAIIGPEQVAYMLDTVQSVGAINEQIAAGQRYFLLLYHNQPVGYCSLASFDKQAHAQLSKLYVRKSARRSGLGRYMLQSIEADCIANGIRTLSLTVNRYNVPAIRFYLRNGFCHERNLCQAIGQGFVMDDFKMLKTIA